MLWILEKKQKNQFNFTAYCISECGSLMTCLASNVALIIHVMTLVITINNCAVTDTMAETVSRCLKIR